MAISSKTCMSWRKPKDCGSSPPPQPGFAGPVGFWIHQPDGSIWRNTVSRRTAWPTPPTSCGRPEARSCRTRNIAAFTSAAGWLLLRHSGLPLLHILVHALDQGAQVQESAFGIHPLFFRAQLPTARDDLAQGVGTQHAVALE